MNDNLCAVSEDTTPKASISSNSRCVNLFHSTFIQQNFIFLSLTFFKYTKQVLILIIIVYNIYLKYFKYKPEKANI